MPKTLVIDDDPETEARLRSHIERVERPFDGQFSFADSDEKALEYLTSGADFDIAVVAIDSEAISGMGLFSQLEDRSFRLPRVALTSGSDLPCIRDAMIAGASDFLLKPIAFDDFISAIERVTKEVEIRRQNWRERSEYSALRREVDIAADMQRRILPRRFPERSGLDIFANVNPAKEMGGDFYDVFEIDDSRIGFVVADVAGKGIPAAFYMAVARTLIRSVAKTGIGPSKCLEQVNSLLFAHEIPGVFVSVFYGEVDTTQWRVTFANGGHKPPFIGGANTGDPQRIEGGDGTILGIQDGLPYEEDAFLLLAGDYLYLYTDGITEAFNSKRVPFSEKRLQECLRKNPGLPAEKLAASVEHTIKQFVGDAEQHDDMTSLVIRRA